MSKIVFTGGGSAGHVTPNLALIDHYQGLQWQTAYIGSHQGIEKDIISLTTTPYYGITTGKLKRYFSWDNALTPFKVIKGIIEAWQHLRKIKPDVVFSKGGFVAFPVVFAAWCQGIPAIIHEADITPGLANRLSLPFAKKICVTFPEALTYYKDTSKVTVTGIPLRPNLLLGDADKGRALCGFDQEKPIIFVVGGSLGASSVNRTVRESLDQLLPTFQIAHICGKGKVDDTLKKMTGYQQFEFLNDTYQDVIAAADIVISRAGANAVYELLSLKKLNILIPLPTTGSRGDQITNAAYYAKLGLSVVIRDEDLNQEKLCLTLHKTRENESELAATLQAYQMPNSVELIHRLISECLNTD